MGVRRTADSKPKMAARGTQNVHVQWGLERGGGKEGKNTKNNYFLVATNVVAIQPPEHRLD